MHLKLHLNKMPAQETTFIHKQKPDVQPSYTDIKPVSDHDMFGCTAFGLTVLSWNMLNPGSPISPGFPSSPLEGMYLIQPSQRDEHLKIAAKYIIDAFVLGADAICLQEVPSPKEQYFPKFLDYLVLFAEEQKLALDFPAFSNSLILTGSKLNPNDQPHFGTAILMKKNLALTSVKELPSERGASYLINDQVIIENHHGNYGDAAILAKKIADSLKEPQAQIIVGDSNIPLVNQQALESLAMISGYSIEPTTNRPQTPDSSRTLDLVLTNDLQANYLIPSSVTKNYSTYTESASLAASQSGLFSVAQPKPAGEEEAKNQLNPQ